MLRQGPLPPIVHGAYEYALGVWLIAAAFVLSYSSNAATAVSIVLGLALLALTAMSQLPTGLVRTVGVGFHVVADLALALVLVASPFVFGYRGEDAPTAASIVAGVVHLLVTIGTRFPSSNGRRTSARSA